MVDDWYKDMEERKIIGVVMLDFTAAFDIIDHDLLLKKLEYYGFSRTALLWMESYLSDRRQLVYFNGSFSKVRVVEQGVPQGSCLGPLLDTIFTNDLPTVLDKASISMFADDSTVYLAGTDIGDLNTKLQRELQLVVNWIRNNKLILNVSKTTCFVVGTPFSLLSKPKLELTIEQNSVEQKEEAKLLGVMIDSRLCWDKHVQKLLTKMGNTLAVIKRCAKYFTPQIVKQVLYALFFSHLDYCSVVWSNTSSTNIKKLQVIQNKAARLALSCGFRSNVDSMHESLSWFKVENRLVYSLMVFLYNVITNKTPFILYAKLSFSTDTHYYPTRHAVGGSFILPIVKTKSIQRSVRYRAMCEWNSLPNTIKQQNTLYGFKKSLKKYYLQRNIYS